MEADLSRRMGGVEQRLAHLSEAVATLVKAQARAGATGHTPPPSSSAAHRHSSAGNRTGLRATPEDIEKLPGLMRSGSLKAADHWRP
jgi:hypothetical protein